MVPLVVCVASAAGLLSAGLAPLPTDNPVNTLYGNGTYPWTDSIAWDSVVSVADFSGDFNKAQDALLAKGDGGGVVYFPAGKYSSNST